MRKVFRNVVELVFTLPSNLLGACISSTPCANKESLAEERTIYTNLHLLEQMHIFHHY